MSKQLARAAAQGFNRQASMIALAFSDSVIATLNDLRTVDVEREDKEAKYLTRGIAASFGHYGTLAEDKPFAYADGIAFIPVTGLLINRFNCSWGWVTGYNAIREQMNAALQDDDVKLIVYDVNSGGGQVAGCFELCNEIFISRATKPSLAMVDSSCYSAAYAIASSATKVMCIPSGGVGSVGVVAMHLDVSGALKEDGYKVTFIYSGDHKIDGNPYQPLPASVKADMQKSVDTTRKEFVNMVARNRGLDAKVVYDTEAQCYSALDALELGLIDAIASPIQAVQAFLNELSGSETTDKEKDMSKEVVNQPGAESSAATPGATAQPAASASAPVQPAGTSAAESKVDENAVRASERARMQAITTCAEAEGKSALANHLAMNTSMTAEEAKAVLAAAAPETAAAGGSAFTAAMDNGKHPDVGAGDTSQVAAETPAQRILKAQALAGGATA